jgi:glycosyltransferase involved in cell wall biosynthesis
MAMKISVITVCFNSAATISDTLRSVVDQTHPDVEHVIVDGGSRDDTVELAHTLGRSGKIIISEPDQGIYDAMNKGLRLATGDLIGFLNADDMYAANDVLARVGALMQQGGLDALYGDTEFVRPSNLNKPIRRYRSDRFRPDRIAWGWMPAHPALFLKRQVFDRYGSFRKDYRIAGDFELVARIFHSGELVYQHIPEVLVRMRTGGISTGGFRSTLLLNQEVLRACRENGISSNWLKLLSKYPSKLAEFFS